MRLDRKSLNVGCSGVDRKGPADGPRDAFAPSRESRLLINHEPMSRTIRCPPRPKSTILDVSRRALLAAMGSTLVSRFSLAQDSLASSNGGDFGQRMQRIANGLRPAVAIA